MENRKWKIPCILLLVLLPLWAGCRNAPPAAAANVPAAQASKSAQIATAVEAIAPATTAPAATQPAADKQEWMALLIDGKKVGHASFTRQTKDGKVTTTMDTTLSMGRAGAKITIKASEQATETAAGEPLSFKAELSMGALGGSKTEGTVKDGKVLAAITQAGAVTKKTLDWPKGAVMFEGADLLARKHGLAQGTKYSVKIFEPSTLTFVDSDMVVGPRTQVDVLGRVVELTQIKATSKVGVSTGYTTDDFDTLRSDTNLAGMNVQMLACPKDYALSPTEELDILTRFLLASPAEIDTAHAKAVTYRLVPTTKDAKIDFPTTDQQKVEKQADGSFLVTVRPLPLEKGPRQAMPYDGKDATAAAMLKPQQYIQSGDKTIVKLAAKARGKAKDAAKAAFNIQNFVATYITKKDLSVGYATAVEVARSREGDCTEHAVLLAALCRASGIPARLATGVAYVPAFGGKKNVFGPHAWVEVYLGGKWVGADAALGTFDAGHITLATGDGSADDFYSTVNNLGQFTIAEVKVEK